MFFFEYIIKLLMGNSESIFMGLVIVIFGYYGWLLWNIHSYFKSFYGKWERHQEYLCETRQGVMNIDKEITKIDQMENRINEMNQLIDEIEENIQKEIKEESEEIKEVVKIVGGQFRHKTEYSKEDLNIHRVIDKVKGGNQYKRKKEES